MVTHARGRRTLVLIIIILFRNFKYFNKRYNASQEVNTFTMFDCDFRTSHTDV